MVAPSRAYLEKKGMICIYIYIYHRFVIYMGLVLFSVNKKNLDVSIRELSAGCLVSMLGFG